MQKIDKEFLKTIRAELKLGKTSLVKVLELYNQMLDLYNKGYVLYKDKYMISKFNGVPYKLIKEKCKLIVASTFEKGTLGYRYKTIAIDGNRMYLHRLVYLLFNGPLEKGLVVDHIDGDRSNNTADNLQLLTCAENSRKTMLKTAKKGMLGRTPVICNETGRRFNSIGEAAEWLEENTYLTSFYSIRNKISLHVNNNQSKRILSVGGYTFKKA